MNRPLENQIDFAIVTAVKDEHDAIINVFGFKDKDRVTKQNRIYWQKKLSTKKGTYNIVTTQSFDQANISAALLAADILNVWKPKIIISVGVAGAISSDVNYGDIVVGEEIYYYERGKITSEGKLPEPKILRSDPLLISTIRSLPKRAISSYKTPEGKFRKPLIHFGIIASGEKVISSAESKEALLHQSRKIIAVEMEGYGIASALWETSNRSKSITIKVIMDKADITKNDFWKLKAAKIAAKFVMNFILDEPIPSTPSKNNISKVQEPIEIKRNGVGGKNKKNRNWNTLKILLIIPIIIVFLLTGKYLIRNCQNWGIPEIEIIGFTFCTNNNEGVDATGKETGEKQVVENLVFADNFENEVESENENWILALASSDQMRSSSVAIENEAMRIDVDFADYYLAVVYTRNRIFDNFIVEFDAAFDHVDPNKETGIAFVLPREDNKDYYVVLFKNDEQIEIAKYDCPYKKPCRYDRPMPYCDVAIELESGINHFQIYANEGNYRLYVNDPERDAPVCEFHNDDMASLSDKIGVGVRGNKDTIVSVVFDNVKVYEFVDPGAKDE